MGGFKVRLTTGAPATGSHDANVWPEARDPPPSGAQSCAGGTRFWPGPRGRCPAQRRQRNRLCRRSIHPLALPRSRERASRLQDARREMSVSGRSRKRAESRRGRDRPAARQLPPEGTTSRGMSPPAAKRRPKPCFAKSSRQTPFAPKLKKRARRSRSINRIGRARVSIRREAPGVAMSWLCRPLCRASSVFDGSCTASTTFFSRFRTCRIRGIRSSPSSSRTTPQQ